MQFSFDATSVSPQESFAPLPAGTYNAVVEDSELKATKSGTGQILNLKWRVLDGQYANRIIFDRINVSNQNKTAEEIGQRQLSALCHAINTLKVSDSSQLHNKPCAIKLAIRTSEGYDPQNEVKGYSAVSGVAAPATNGAQSATPPWARK